METAGLVLRVALSLGCVLALMWLAARGLRRSPVGRAAAASTVSVLSRQSVGQRASVAVVKVGERALVLGVTEQRITLIAEARLDEVEGVVPAVVRSSAVDVDVTGVATSRVAVQAPGSTCMITGRGAGPHAAVTPGGLLAGSALSPQTWSRAIEVVRDRTARR